MYRYRDNSGATSRSLVAVKRHLHKIGKVNSVRGYIYFGKYKTNHVGVMVKGEKGSLRFSGFSWGYAGEGVRGLQTLLQTLGVEQQEIQRVVSGCQWDGWSGEPREIWKITL